MRVVRGLMDSFYSFVADDCPTLAAALAYYTVFSLPPLIFLLVTVLTWSLTVLSDDASAEDRARRIVVRHAATILGNETIQEEVGAILSTNEKSRVLGGSLCWELRRFSWALLACSQHFKIRSIEYGMSRLKRTLDRPCVSCSNESYR